MVSAKEYLKREYLLEQEINVEIQGLEQLRNMIGTIQGCSYGEKVGSNPNRNTEGGLNGVSHVYWLSSGQLW